MAQFTRPALNLMIYMLDIYMAQEGGHFYCTVLYLWAKSPHNNQPGRKHAGARRFLEALPRHPARAALTVRRERHVSRLLGAIRLRKLPPVILPARGNITPGACLR